MPPPTYEQRVFDVEDVETSERCLVCGAPRATPHAAARAAGVATGDMTVPVPDFPLCEACGWDQLRAERAAHRRTLVAALVPSALAAATVIAAPGNTPLVVVLASVLALIGSRVAFALIRRQRGRASPILLLDGAGTDVLVQVRRPGRAGDAVAGGASLVYREIVREGGSGKPCQPARAHGPGWVALLGSSLAPMLVMLVGWFGAYPALVLDDPKSLGHVTVDGVVMSTGRGSVELAVRYGRHFIAWPGQAPREVDVRFGGPLLLSSDPAQCYELREASVPPMRGAQRILRAEYTRQRRGPVVEIGAPRDVSRAECALPPLNFQF